MTSSEFPTTRVDPAPVILVVGCNKPFTKRCRDAAIIGQALVVETDLVSAPTIAAQTRPLAMIMLEDVCAFDMPFFTGIASAVRSQLVMVANEEIAQPELEALILQAILNAEEKRASY